jgi:hypothetical protein
MTKTRRSDMSKADKPHPTGISASDGEAVARLMQEQREAAARAKAPKSDKPEDVNEIISNIVAEGKKEQPEAPAKEEKKGLLGRFRRG